MRRASWRFFKKDKWFTNATLSIPVKKGYVKQTNKLLLQTTIANYFIL